MYLGDEPPWIEASFNDAQVETEATVNHLMTQIAFFSAAEVVPELLANVGAGSSKHSCSGESAWYWPRDLWDLPTWLPDESHQENGFSALA